MERPEESTTATRNASTLPVAWGPVAALGVTLGAYTMSIVFAAIGDSVLDITHQHWPTLLQGQRALIDLLFTIFSAIGLLGFLGMYMYWHKMHWRDLGFRKPVTSDVLWLLKAIGVYIVLVFVVMNLLSLISDFDVNQQQRVGYVGVQGLGLVFAFLGLVVLPPLTEEILFRGFLYRGLATRWPKILAAIVTSALFGIVHLQWNVAIDTFLLSLVLIWLFEHTKNLWTCVALHAIKNSIAFYVLFIVGS